MNVWFTRLVAAGTVVLASWPAVAGIKDGTLTVALDSPVEAVDIYMGPGAETAMTTSAVFNPLVAYDAETKSYVGVIARSWSQIDPETMEFKLKPGLTFQDGSVLDAEDVAYTINFISNPETKFRLKSRFAFFAGAEKVDDLTVRVKTRGPYPMLMARMIGVPVYPSDKHSALGADYASWGRAPIGSGPYKVVKFNESTGIEMERWDGYKLGPAPAFKRIVFKPLPDAQTQIAEMMIGNIDVMMAKSPDQVAALTANPRIVATPISDMNFQYMYLDAVGHSGLSVFKDERVRAAVFHAVDRDAIRKSIVAGGAGKTGVAHAMARLCFPFQVGCPDGGTPQAYDPAKARALLKEAGLADGFDLKVSTWGSSRPIAEAVVGYLRAVGIRASVDVLTLGAYRKKQVEGGLQALVSNYVYGGLPDTGAVVDFFFSSSDRDYFGDKRLFDLTKQANTTLDEKKRGALFRETLDIVEKQAFILPITTDPVVVIHSADVKVDAATRGNILFARFSFFESYGKTPPMLGWAK